MRKQQRWGKVLGTVCILGLVFASLTACSTPAKEADYPVTDLVLEMSENETTDNESEATSTMTTQKTTQTKATMQEKTTTGDEKQETSNKSETTAVKIISNQSTSLTNRPITENENDDRTSFTSTTTIKQTEATYTTVSSETEQTITVTTEELHLGLYAMPTELAEMVEKEKNKNPGIEIAVLMHPLSQSGDCFVYNNHTNIPVPTMFEKWSFAYYVMWEAQCNKIDLSYQLEDVDFWNLQEMGTSTLAKVTTRMILENSGHDYELLNSLFTEYEEWRKNKFYPSNGENQNIEILSILFEELYLKGRWAETANDEFIFSVMKNYPNSFVTKKMDGNHDVYHVSSFENNITSDFAIVDQKDFYSIIVIDDSGKEHSEFIADFSKAAYDYFSTEEGAKLWREKTGTEF